MPATRRQFLAASAVVATNSPHLFAAGNDLIRIGLIGCGDRGTGAAVNALGADPNVKLVAMGDAFEDRLKSSLANLLAKKELGPKVDVKPEAQFVGFDAYQAVIERSDVVLLCTPPQFRPLHLQAAIAAGKHVFAEKPCAVDAPGVRSVLASCEQARKKNLSVVSGLCLRYDNGFREAVRRIHDGAVGKVVTILANDYRGGRWDKPRLPGWSDMTYQMRNWYNFTWLSGDFNVEQHVHFLDVCAWLMKERYPTRAVGMGGRAVLTGTQYGNIYDHFSVVYEYDDGSRIISSCRQQPRCKNDMSVQALGAKGRALLSEKEGGMWIKGDQNWSFDGPANQMYQSEHDELFASIRRGKPINNGDYMANSTLLAIMGRMAAYTGQEVTWKMAQGSQERLSPDRWDWDAKLPEAPVATPGVTKFL